MTDRDSQVVRLEDAEARRLAATVFDRSFVLEAGAGTGKTAALVARIVAWAVGPGWRQAAANRDSAAGEDEIAAAVLEGIVAITFTEDAAAEMTRRVAQAFGALATNPRLEDAVTGLDPAALPEDPSVVPARAALLMQHLERLRTSTIHSFAQSLISRWPVEAGLHPSFEVDADKVATSECVERVVEDLLADAYRGGLLEGEALVLASRGLGPVDVRDAALVLVLDGIPASALAEDPFSSERLRPVVSGLLAHLDAFVPYAGRLTGVPRSPRTTDAADWLLDLAALDRGPAEEDPRTFLIEASGRLLQADDAKGNLTKLRKWVSKKDRTNGEEKILEEASEEEIQALAGMVDAIGYVLELDPPTFEALRLTLHEVLVRVEAERQRLGVVVFQDLLVEARRLLERQPAVRTTLRAEISQLLVDEMQDTDAEQARIVELLGMPDETGEGPCLFLVGDPKQSIYGWRNADLAVYGQLVLEVEKRGGLVRDLTVNFRSVQPVLDEVTRLVEPVMEETEGLQPPFLALLTGRADGDPDIPGGGSRAAVEHWVSAGESGGLPEALKAREAAELEAEAVARDAASLWASGTPLAEMAILMRTRNHQPVYLEALRRHGVPYVVGKDENYYRTREVTEMVALVRVVLDPFDVVALVAVLRSPMVGVPDAALAPLWKAGLPEESLRLGGGDEDPIPLRRVIERAEEEVAGLDLGAVSLAHLAGWPAALLSFLESLSRLRRAFDEEPPDVFLEHLRRRLLPEPLAASRFPGAYRLANVERFLAELEERLVGGDSAQEVVRHLRRADRDRPDQESGRPASDVDGVRVLTIHGVKGLGFDHVWLVQTHAGTGSRSGGNKTGARWMDGRWEMELSGRRTPGYAAVRARREEVAEAERVRLLYVALTRAKRRLVTVGGAVTKKSAASSMSALMDQRSGGRPAPAELWPDSGSEPGIDRGNARWVWLGHPRWDIEMPGRKTPPAEAGVLDPARFEADRTALDERRGWAGERQERPWLSAASEEAHRLFHEEAARRVEGGEEEPPPEVEMKSGERVPLAVGTAVHGVLERFEHGAADPTAELDGRVGEALKWLDGVLVDEEDRAAARRRFTEIVESFRNGPLWPLFLALDGSILARELPLAVAPEPDGAVGAVTGSIDLVYRDPDGGAVVVADFKTDRVEGDELQERARVYSSQLDFYARGLQRALRLEAAPRRELWFISAGIVHTLD